MECGRDGAQWGNSNIWLALFAQLLGSSNPSLSLSLFQLYTRTHVHVQTPPDDRTNVQYTLYARTEWLYNSERCNSQQLYMKCVTHIGSSSSSRSVRFGACDNPPVCGWVLVTVNGNINKTLLSIIPLLFDRGFSSNIVFAAFVAFCCLHTYTEA